MMVLLIWLIWTMELMLPPSTSLFIGEIQSKEIFRICTYVSLDNNRFGQFQTISLNLFAVKLLGESFLHELVYICRHTHTLRLHRYTQKL